MEKKFKPNDIVRLKSGGPKMTVIDYYMDDTEGIKAAIYRSGKKTTPKETSLVICEWFDDNNRYGKNNFEQDALELA